MPMPAAAGTSQVFTPTSDSWLNQVEGWFGTLTQKYICRDNHRSTRQLEQTIRHHIKINIDDPKPFAWLKSTDNHRQD